MNEVHPERVNRHEELKKKFIFDLQRNERGCSWTARRNSINHGSWSPSRRRGAASHSDVGLSAPRARFVCRRGRGLGGTLSPEREARRACRPDRKARCGAHTIRFINLPGPFGRLAEDVKKKTYMILYTHIKKKTLAHRFINIFSTTAVAASIVAVAR